MILSNKLLLSLGLISILSNYTNYSNQDANKISRNKSTDDKDDYLATILVRANEVEVFDQKTNRWITYRNLSRLEKNNERNKTKRFEDPTFTEKEATEYGKIYGSKPASNPGSEPQSNPGSEPQSNPGSEPQSNIGIGFGFSVPPTQPEVKDVPVDYDDLLGSTEQPVPSNKKCFREEYVPGTKENPGYIKKVEIPCSAIDKDVIKKTTGQDINDCLQGSAVGALLGTGLSLSLSRGKDRWWAIPAGGTSEALVGCQVDGG